MVSRVATSALLGAARARPMAAGRAIAPITTARYSSTAPAEEPKKKAASILDALPGNSLVSKAAILSSGTAAAIAAISNELYVMNEETVVAVSLLTVFYGVGKFVGPLYSEYAQANSNKVKEILNAARQEHTVAVRERITNVQELAGVVDHTKALFGVSKETARLEAKAYELEQTTAIAAEAKSVLDSWVRYEGQVKARQQKELSEFIINKIEKDLQNPKALRQILDQSVAEVERILAAKR